MSISASSKLDVTASNADKPRICVAGNSHVRYLLGGHCSQKHDHGSFVAYGRQFGDTGSTIWGLLHEHSRTGAGREIAKFVKHEAALLPDDQNLKLVLCLGEVDVRAHVLKHSTTVKTCADVIWELIYRYESWLAENVEEHCGDSLCLMGTIPYTRKFFEDKPPSRKLLSGYIPGLFNAALAGLCNERDWTYIDMYDGFVDDEGFLRDELSCDPEATDDVHLNYALTGEMLKPQMERYLASHR